jgi:lysophospholipase L1-like esterase
MTPFLKKSALMLGSFGLTLVCLEGVLRVFHLAPKQFGAGRTAIFYRFDPVLGWANLAANSGQFTRAEFSHPVTTNSLGMRDREMIPQRDGMFRIAVLGDSFTWGLGAAYGERFTEVMEDTDPRLDVLNFGVSGYAPVQYLLEIEQILAVKPDFVLLAFCLSNDLIDNVPPVTSEGYQRPYARLAPGGNDVEIVGYPLAMTTRMGRDLEGEDSSLVIVAWLKRYWAQAMQPKQLLSIDTFFKRSEDLTAEEVRARDAAYEVNRILLGKIRDKVQAALGPDRFAVLLVPGKEFVGMASAKVPRDADPSTVAVHLRQTLSDLAIPVIDGREVIRPEDFWENDGHWRPSGHAKVGRLLVDFLARVLPSKLPP